MIKMLFIVYFLSHSFKHLENRESQKSSISHGTFVPAELIWVQFMYLLFYLKCLSRNVC